MPRPRRRRRGEVPFRVPIAKSQPLGPETHGWYFHPNRPGVRFASREFVNKLREAIPEADLEITWNPVRERWCVWQRAPRIQHPICQGWRLLFVVEYEGEYVPLDERVLAVLYERSGRKWGNLFYYWQAVEREMDRDREQSRASRYDDVGHAAGDYFDYMKIKNYGKGSKFVNHFS